MELSEYRSNFPVTEKRIHFNHAVASPVCLPVMHAVERFLKESSEFDMGSIGEWMGRIQKIRENTARFMGAGDSEIAFIRSTAHGLSLIAQGLDWKEGDNMVTASCEFPSNIYPWMNLNRRGVETRMVDPRDGEIHLEDIREKVDARTRLVSLSWVEYQNGFRNDLEEIGSFCRGKGIYFCVDGIQGAGALPLNLHALPVDFFSSGGHKWLLAPVGVGCLYVSERVMERVHPVIVGWHSVKHAGNFANLDFTLREDARKFEEGSSSMMGIFAFGAAVDLLSEAGAQRIWEKIRALHEHAIEGLKQKGYEILSPLKQENRSGILTFGSSRHAPEKIFERLTEAHVVAALRGGGIRISPHFYNTVEEVDRMLEVLL